MLNMTRLGRIPLTILTVLELEVVAPILNLVKRREVISSLWTDGLLLIIITDVLTGPSTPFRALCLLGCPSNATPEPGSGTSSDSSVLMNYYYDYDDDD